MEGPREKLKEKSLKGYRGRGKGQLQQKKQNTGLICVCIKPR